MKSNTLITIVITLAVALALPRLTGCEALGFASKAETAKIESAVDAAEAAKVDAESAQAETAEIKAELAAQQASIQGERKALQTMLAQQTAALASADDASAGVIESTIAVLSTKLGEVKATETQVNAALGKANSAAKAADARVAAAQSVIDRVDSKFAALAERDAQGRALIPQLIRGVGGAVGGYVPGAGAIGEQGAGLATLLLGGGAIGGLWQARKKSKEAEEAKKVSTEIVKGLDAAKMKSPELVAILKQFEDKIMKPQSPETQAFVAATKV